MADDFKTQIDKFVVNTEKKMLVVVRESIEATIEDAQTSVDKGGKMRVKTGFLHASGLGQLGSMPSGPSKGDPKGKYVWTTDQLGVILASMKIGDVFYFGWTAKYARHREVFDGFLDSATMKWQSHVDESVRRFKK